MDFRSVGALKYHIRGHTKEKPFKRQGCGQDFKCLTELKRHSNVHLIRKKENSNSIAEILRLQLSVKHCEVRLERLVS